MFGFFHEKMGWRRREGHFDYNINHWWSGVSDLKILE